MAYGDIAKIDFDRIVQIHYEAAKMPPEQPCIRAGVKNYSPIIEIEKTLKGMIKQKIRCTWIATVVMKDISTGQPFHDCNRRTSFLVASTILELCGYSITVSLEEAEEMGEKIMWLPLVDIEKWIIGRLTPPWQTRGGHLGF